MVMTDPIADMFTRIRNAHQAKHRTTDMPLAKIKVQIARVLKEEGYIRGYRFLKDDPQGTLRILLKYDGSEQPLIINIERVSKPGRRVFRKVKEIKRILNGFGIALVSTPKGVMADWKARKEHIGGEILGVVW